jgi:endonuclease V-like protein UPF0215 family
LTLKKFRVVKPEIRVLGIDDGAFTPHKKGFALIVGVVFRGGYWLDGVMSTKVRVDGFDSTKKVTSMVVSSPHYKQLRVIMLNGVTFGGFNVIDIKKLHKNTGLPVIAITRNKPNFNEIREAIKNLPKSEKRWKTILNAGNVFETATRNKNEKVYMEIAGILEEDARKILRLTSTRSSIPEALRVAHVIASGINLA